MAESVSSSSEQHKSKITFEVNLDTNEVDIKYKDNPTWSHITKWNCEVVPAPFDIHIHKELHLIRNLQKACDGCLDVTLSRIRSRKRCLIFTFGHDTLDDAVQMATMFVEVKDKILEFIQEIDAKVTDISLRCWVGELNGSSEQFNKNADGLSIKSESILFSGESKGYKSKTDWFCKLEKDEFEMDLTSSSNIFTKLKRIFDNSYRCKLNCVIRGSLIIQCEHESREDALEMLKNHVKVKATILECLHEMDPRVNAIIIEVEYKETDPLLEPGHPDERYVDKQEHDQDVHNLQQQVSYLMKQIQEMKEMERQQLSDTRMSLWMRPDSPQPSESTGFFTATDTITDVGEELFQTTEDLSEAEGRHRHKRGVNEPGQTSGSVTHLTGQLADLKQELKATTERLHRLETTHKKAPDTDTGRGPGRRDTPQGSDQHGGASSHPSEMEELSPGATQESELPVTSREEETQKSGTPLGRSSDTPATPTPARRDPGADRDLLDASSEGNMAAVKRILTAGRADINCRDVVGRTPVMEAAWSGHRDMVELLVSEGADVSLVDEVGNNTLHHACWGGDVETVKFVLSLHVADINSRGERSRTPVMMAAVRGHRDVVELLVSEGADVSLVDGRGNNILHHACIRGDVETVKFVLSLHVADINSRGVGSWTPVMAAAYWGHRDVVELLVSEGADVSLVDEDGDNILHHACWGGDVETVKFVLSLHVVDIDARNNDGRTAADWARLGGHQKVVKLLQPPRCHVM